MDGFDLVGWSVAELGVQAGVAEQPDPFQGGEFDFVDGAPWLAGFDQLSFEQPVDRFSQSVVVGVTNGASGCLDS